MTNVSEYRRDSQPHLYSTSRDMNEHTDKRMHGYMHYSNFIKFLCSIYVLQDDPEIGAGDLGNNARGTPLGRKEAFASSGSKTLKEEWQDELQTVLDFRDDLDGSRWCFAEPEVVSGKPNPPFTDV